MKLLSAPLDQALSEAKEIAKTYKHSCIRVEHVFFALIGENLQSYTYLALTRLGLDVTNIRDGLKRYLEVLEKTSEETDPIQTPRLEKILGLAQKEAEKNPSPLVHISDFLLACVTEGSSVSFTIMQANGFTLIALLKTHLIGA